MRAIGTLENEAQARMFGDFLYAQGIHNQVEPDAGRWAVWVHDEEHLEPAARLLAQFRQEPGDPKYQEASRAARERRERERRENETAQRRYFDRGKLFPERFYGIGVFTAFLMAASALVTFVTDFGSLSSPLFPRWFAIANFVQDGAVVDPGVRDVLRGEVWRLFTPIFVHFNLLHILFNLLWLKDLGSLIEHQQGRWTLLGLVLLIAAPSNLAQALLGASGPLFGGMSGVVYGLLGYVWLRGRFDPASGLYVDRQAVVLMLLWFFLCLFNYIPHVANVVHGVGLAVGLLTGTVSAWVARWRLGR